VSAQCNRVPVVDGHMVAASFALEQKPAVADVIQALTAMAKSYETLANSGLHYESPTANPMQQALVEFSAGQVRTLDLRMELERLSAKVVVTAEAEPQEVQETNAPVTIITRDQIEKQEAVTLPDVLLYTPGVSIGRTGPEGGTASIFLNGGNSSYTKVLVDGTPVNEPGNAVDFSNFTLDNIDKVEIVRGAESAIYGTDAVAGVIQVFTHRGTTRVPEFSVFGDGGSFATGRGGAQVSGTG
jgi:outer membrane cobalamin receptor